MVLPGWAITLWVFCAVAGVAIASLVFGSIKKSWGRLAEAYPLSRPFPADVFEFQVGQFGYLGLKGCLTFGADRQGIYLRTWKLFEWLLNPLFIPWTDIQATPGGKLDRSKLRIMWWSGGFVALKFPRIQGINLKISAQLWEQLNAKRTAS